MEYVSVKIPDRISVGGIYTLFERDIKRSSGIGLSDVHDFPEIIYMRSGSRRILINGRENELCAGQIIIYAPGSVHVAKEASDCSLSIVSFDASEQALAPLYNRVITLNEKQNGLLCEIFKDGCKCFTRRESSSEAKGMVLTADADEATLFGIRKSLEHFLADLLRCEQNGAGEKTGREFDSVIQFLRSKIHLSLTVSEIATECGMSVSKLKYLFRENYRGGVINCFIEMKIGEAKRLIRNGGYNFSEIAERLSFNSLHYFSRVFKKTVGISPSEYLKKFR